MAADGVTVLVTRPISQGRGLCEKLSHAGYTPVHVPVLAIEPLGGGDEEASIRTCLASMDRYDGVIVVSLNAAEQWLHWMQEFPLESAIPVFSVGRTTAEFLQQQGMSVRYPTERMDSEGLLALPELQVDCVRGKRFLVIRGIGGRELLAETLQSRGALVESCSLYRRYCPEENAKELCQAITRSEIIQINSVESADNFFSLLNPAAAQAGVPVPGVVENKTWLVPGQRVADHLQQLCPEGEKVHIIIADNATDDAMLAAIAGQR